MNGGAVARADAVTPIPFASSYAEPAGSPIRELFRYLGRPGMISLAGGYPSPSLFDVEGLQQASARAMADSMNALQYGATEGDLALRTELQRLSATRAIDCQLANLLVTTGSQQGFDLLVRVLIEPGDVVLVETPTYPATIQALRLAQARIVQVPVDDDGLMVHKLEAALAAMPVSQRPKLLYTVPSFSNPCGTLLSTNRRRKLVELALRYRFLVVEDDPYGELTFGAAAPGTVFMAGHSLAGQRNPVIYLSTLSKTVAPALRIGWMIAPGEVVRRCVIAKQTVDLCTSPVMQAVAAQYLASGRYPAAVARMRSAYGARMRVMVDALHERLVDQVEFVEPAGGMFVWLRTKANLDPTRLFDAATQAGVLFVPGRAFYASDPDHFTLRLSYAASNRAQILEAIARLAKAFSESLAGAK
ncbi:2-aminoadipate transaminase (plasmid) [Variovorax sp. SRS16]|uniref:aminotransferase-like domain-containing protein n=1 Tax=Variovorax sp. SRS16 TaxID=282217 RepID=UPI001315FEB1|nr:PLP-dependent aminotransferase family protein [Variovorax sp. SRS16]VTU45858.1 2-aminoadipate transaminase [Variovorax sp. SRS16]